MQNFTKTLPKRHPLSTEIRNLHGAEAFTYLTDLLDLVQDIGTFELTPQIVARECGLKSQKVQRIFEDLKRIFEESCKILELSLKNPEESLKNPQRSDAQNPHGSTHAHARPVSLLVSNINNQPTNEPTNSEPDFSQEEIEFASQAEEIYKNDPSPNVVNNSWVKGFSKLRYREAKQSRPDLSSLDLLSVWQLVCASAAKNGAHKADWYQKAWNSQLNSYQKPAIDPPKQPSVSNKGTEHPLRDVPLIFYEGDNKVYRNDELRFEPDGVFHGQTRMMPALLHDAEVIGRAG